MSKISWRNICAPFLLLIGSYTANAEVVINEVLGSTTSADNEYIELYNTGAQGAVDISGWTITLYESDIDEATFGSLDAASPYTVPAGTILLENDFFLFANSLAESAFNVTADASLPSNAIENSSYTMVLRDASDNVLNTIFVTDSNVNDQANIEGTAITPDFTFGPDGTFLPAGFFRTTDGGDELGLLEFAPQPSLSGTPGFSNVPPPAIVINEVLGSTTGADNEYIELFNTGSQGAVDISGWSVTLYDGDVGGSFGGTDASSPYVVPADTLLQPEEFFLFANELAQTAFNVIADVTLPSNAIENGSYTLVLRDASDNVINTVFVVDDDIEDAANIAGTTIDPDLTVGPDGTFLPAGFNRIPNGSDNFVILEFSPQPSASGTPESSLATPIDPVDPVAIYEIQGATHTSPLLGQIATTTGVVTAVDVSGFYLQDPNGDSDIATSDAIFVAAGGVSVGDFVEATGTVAEVSPGGSTSLTRTTLSFANAIVVSSDNALPSPVILGEGGRIPPSENIDDDAFASFDPETDGIDFFESVESMLVTAPSPLASSGTNRFGEIFVVGDNGVNATGLSERQTLNISPDDFNPEKIQIDANSNILPGFDFPFVDTGATLSDVTGVVSYGFGNFEIFPTQPFTVIDSTLEPETTSISAGDNTLTIASYNVLNLETNDGDGDTDVANGRFELIANQIVNNLNTPDIVGLQEIQDNSGSVNDGVTEADVTLQALVDAILSAGGPRYEFADTEGLVDGAVGGQPGGNIRVAFLYNPDRVDLIDAAPITDPSDQASNPENPFFGSRLSVAAEFVFNGETVTVVNNHFSSKGGSAAILGTEQPFDARQEDVTVNGSLDERQLQANAVNDFVTSILALDPEANLVVLGDFNEFEFVSPVSTILGTNLENLTNTLPEDERYSFVFQGNSQSLDHILVSDSLVDDAQFDIVHVNSEFAETSQRASDHDPLVVAVSFAVSVPGDIDADGDADFRDLRLLLRSLGAKDGDARFNAAADLDNNGVVNFRDLFTFIKILRESKKRYYK